MRSLGQKKSIPIKWPSLGQVRKKLCYAKFTKFVFVFVSAVGN